MNAFRLLVYMLGLVTAINNAYAATDPCNLALSKFDYPTAMADAHLALASNPGDGGQLICLGRAEYESGDFRTALSSLTAANNTELTPPQRVLLQNWFGVTLRRLGRLQEAWQAQQIGLNLARQINDMPGLATALHNTAGMLYDQGYASQAIQAYRSSLAINPDAAERSASHNNIGLILQAQGDWIGAEQELAEAIRINRAGGHFHHLGKHLMNLGNLRRLQGRYAEAEALINEGEPLEEKAGDRYWQAVASRYRGWLARDQGKIALAMNALKKARMLYLEAGSPVEADQTEQELAQLGQR
jgi:tetratricopeptide (TPR) repeat protein